MQKLTENIIHQKIRPCPTDLSRITQLNVTGRGLSDVSIIKKLVGLEIISLSVNKISSLAFFENCLNLRVLYLRQNKITDLMEIKYLIHLPKLEILTLSQNPCAEEPLYRFTVIKHLKNLTELDEIPIEDEDKREAELLGRNLSTPVNSSHILSSSSYRLLRSRSKLNQALKLTPSTILPDTMSRLELIRRNISMEDALNDSDFSSKLKTSQSRSQRSCTDDYGPGLLGAASVSRFTPLQCRNGQDSKIDFLTISSPCLPVIEEPRKMSNGLMAALYVTKDLGNSDLRVLHTELTARLNGSSNTRME